jgi:hypothetical protein
MVFAAADPAGCVNLPASNIGMAIALSACAHVKRSIGGV